LIESRLIPIALGASLSADVENGFGFGFGFGCGEFWCEVVADHQAAVDAGFMGDERRKVVASRLVEHAVHAPFGNCSSRFAQDFSGLPEPVRPSAFGARRDLQKWVFSSKWEASCR
jgi:hypothetical protein|tara:strand:- start:8619 stop:8966 length:348 start_codon:yes stop_codon:yes gene_type:complete